MHDSPNVTAAVVASTLLLSREDPELSHLVDRRSTVAVERVVREVVPAIGWALDHVPWPILYRAARVAERVVSPGFVEHYARRKHVVREHLAAAIADGFRQVVLLGAGFDMLAASVPADVAVFEVDHPATQAAKRRALEGDTTRAVVHVAAELGRVRLRDVLAGSGFAPERDTVFVAEGLVMYLERAVVASIFEDVAAPGRRSRLVASFVTPDRRGHARLHSQRSVVDLCMRLLGESFVWGESAAATEALLVAHGLVPETVASPDAADARPTGEVIVVASSQRNESAGKSTVTTSSSPRSVNGEIPTSVVRT